MRPKTRLVLNGISCPFRSFGKTEIASVTASVMAITHCLENADYCSPTSYGPGGGSLPYPVRLHGWCSQATVHCPSPRFPTRLGTLDWKRTNSIKQNHGGPTVLIAANYYLFLGCPHPQTGNVIAMAQLLPKCLANILGQSDPRALPARACYDRRSILAGDLVIVRGGEKRVNFTGA